MGIQVTVFIKHSNVVSNKILDFMNSGSPICPKPVGRVSRKLNKHCISVEKLFVSRACRPIDFYPLQLAIDDFYELNIEDECGIWRDTWKATTFSVCN